LSFTFHHFFIRLNGSSNEGRSEEHIAALTEHRNLFFFLFSPPWNERQVMDGVIFSLGFFFSLQISQTFWFPFLLGNGFYLLQNPYFPFVLWAFFPFLSLLLPFYHRVATFFFFFPSFSIFFLYCICTGQDRIG